MNRLLSAIAICVILLALNTISTSAQNSASGITKLWASEVTTSSALIGWRSNTPAGSFTIEFGKIGFTPGSGTITSSNMNPFELSGLAPGSVYHCYVTEIDHNGNAGKQTGPIIIETLNRSFSFDASVGAVERYTKIPINQASFYPTAIVSNTGSNTLTDISVKYQIKNAGGTIVFDDSSTVFSLNVGEVVNAFDNTSFTATATGYYTSEYSIQNGNDLNNDNDFYIGTTFEVTTNTYSRDDGLVQNGLGISGTGTIFQGNEFEIIAIDEIRSVDVNFTGGQAGDSVQVLIFELNSKIPGNPVAQSIVQVLAGAGTGMTNIALTNSFTINPGKYVIGLKHFAHGVNISLNYSNSLYVPYESWMKIDQGKWENPESAGYEATYIIHPVFRYCTAVNLSSQITNVDCHGAMNGAIDIVPAGGTAPFTYFWSNGTTTQDLINTQAGNYMLTITDAIGCMTFTNAMKIQEPEEILSNTTITQLTSAGSNDGTIVLSITGGTGPYTYNWSNGITTQNLSALSAGNYCVTITDASMCSNTFCYDINTISTGIEAHDLISLFETYPNPTTGNTNITVKLSKSENATIELLDILGNIMQVHSNNSELSMNLKLDIHNYPSGIYMIRLSAGGKILTKRIILK